MSARTDPKVFDVVVVGAGFAGMYAIYRYRELGLDIAVIEAGSDVGGTWYWNRYPGARCDVPSLEYSFGFSPELEQQWDWPEVFSAQTDILAYANHIADRFDLRRSITFNTRVTAARYDQSENLWALQTDQGTTVRGRFCVMATGCLSVPNTPQLPGAERFEGEVLHTGRWPKEGADLGGKRVGVIGTGSSGVQAIPELAKQAEELIVFQRTPVYTLPANRKRMRADVQDEFRRNYREIRALQQDHPGGVSAYRPGRGAPTPNPDGSVARRGNRRLLDFSEEERRDIMAREGLNALLTFSDVLTDPQANEIANDLYRDEVRRQVTDPVVAERLLPKDYGLGCKRQVIDRDYYATFNRDNVTLVDLQTTPLQAVTADGIDTSDESYPLDVLIYATGFDAMTGALLKADIQGRDGRRLADKWRYGPLTYLGLQVRDFPNLFTVTGPGSPSVLCNMLVAIEQHINWIGDCITFMQRSHHTTIEPLEQSEAAWAEHVNDVAEGTMYTAPSCNSWYLGANIAGKPRLFMPYVGGYPRYRRHCEHETDNAYPGFEVA